MAGGLAARMIATAPRIKEAEVSRAVARYLGLFAPGVVRRNTGGRRNASGGYVAFGRPGDPDFSGPLPDGRHAGIEVKRPGARPSARQFATLRRLNERGAVAFWVDSLDYLAHVLPVILAGGRCEIREDGEPIFFRKG